MKTVKGDLIQLIGAGLAGGDWTKIVGMLRFFERSLKGVAFLTIVEYNSNANV